MMQFEIFNGTWTRTDKGWSLSHPLWREGEAIEVSFEWAERMRSWLLERAWNDERSLVMVSETGRACVWWQKGFYEDWFVTYGWRPWRIRWRRSIRRDLIEESETVVFSMAGAARLADLLLGGFIDRKG